MRRRCSLCIGAAEWPHIAADVDSITRGPVRELDPVPTTSDARHLSLNCTHAVSCCIFIYLSCDNALYRKRRPPYCHPHLLL